MSIFDENVSFDRRVYAIHKPEGEIYLDSETRLFLNHHISGVPYKQNALDLEQQIDVMVNTRVGFQERFFRSEGTRTNRPGLVGLPNPEDEGNRLRLYGYRRTTNLLLIGGGCLKLHDLTGAQTALDHFPECQKSANLIKGVQDGIETLKRMNRIIERPNGYYNGNGVLKRDFTVTVNNALR